MPRKGTETILQAACTRLLQGINLCPARGRKHNVGTDFCRDGGESIYAPQGDGNYCSLSLARSIKRESIYAPQGDGNVCGVKLTIFIIESIYAPQGDGNGWSESIVFLDIPNQSMPRKGTKTHQ